MMRPLRAPGLRRAVALLLSAVFLAAGTTVPGADALLHHWGQADRAEHHAHIEPAGGCANHAEACTLGRTATGAGAALAHAPVIRPAPRVGAPPLPVPSGLAPAAHHRRLPPSRAPPLPVA